MIVISGKGASGGTAFGKAVVYSRKRRLVKRSHVTDAEAEIERFRSAKKSTREELAGLAQHAKQTAGEEEAMIFEIHAMMLEDQDYIDSVENAIREQLLNAESAVAMASDSFSQMLLGMDDEYMRGRAADVRDVSERLISVLCGEKTGMPELTEGGVILIADDLTPSETVQLDPRHILGFVTENGSGNSHTAILARTMGIPAITSAGNVLGCNPDGKDVIIDGSSGKLYIEPDPQTRKKLSEQKKREERERTELMSYSGRRAVTSDGREVGVYANIGNINDVEAALKNGADGIGLFRSEFLYMDRDSVPDEEEQFRVYKSILEGMGTKPVVIRTFDIGADKRAAGIVQDREENPALGVRGLRVYFEHMEMFRTQLRALYRASAYGKLAIMFPMVTRVDEVTRLRNIASDVCAQLKNSGEAVDDKAEIGVMIETPAAVWIAEELAEVSDFFSIGTNDLMQYTFAADRQNDKTAALCDPLHPALERMIRHIAGCAAKAGIWTGVCGDMSSNTELTRLFVSCGINELSAVPNKIPVLKKTICSM